MSDEQQAKRRGTVLPPALGTPSAVGGEEAPVEAVRAIAALLGRAALPTGTRVPADGVVLNATRAQSNDMQPSEEEQLRGDREVSIAGAIAALSDEADSALRDARKRQRRAQRRVEEVLERISAEVPDALSS